VPKKTALQSVHPNEVKKQVTVRLYPTQLQKITGKYGSLQKAIDALI